MIFLKGLGGALEVVGVVLACLFVFGTGVVLIVRWLSWFMQQLA